MIYCKSRVVSGWKWPGQITISTDVHCSCFRTTNKEFNVRQTGDKLERNYTCISAGIVYDPCKKKKVKLATEKCEKITSANTNTEQI